MVAKHGRKKGTRKKGGSSAGRHVIKACEYFKAGDQRRAVDACIAAATTRHKTLKPFEATLICEILDGCGASEAAEKLRQKVLIAALEAAAQNQDSAQANCEAGYFLLESGAEQDSEPFLRKALQLSPDDKHSAFMLLRVLLKRGAPEELIAAWEPYIAATDQPGNALLCLAKGLAHFGFGEHAEEILQRAEQHFPPDDHTLSYAAAGIRGQELSLDQKTLAIEMFDNFANFYDQNLSALGNSGPVIIGAMLKRLPLVPAGSLEVLDAGCGTGLCVPFLRPYARQLHGCDFSVGMLQAAHAKGIYDLLTRTDLGVAETLPAGPFDLIVCADVFVYFGDLCAVLTNLADKLRPGGWLIFTTEDAGDAELPKGYRLASSGRYTHSEAHLLQALAASGFMPPADQMTATLRLEFGMPVTGRAVAACKRTVPEQE